MAAAGQGHLAFVCTLWILIVVIDAVRDRRIYYDHDEKTLLHWIKAAERELKFYIYPMPPFVENKIVHSCSGHFGFECGLPNYLRSLKTNIHPDEPVGSRNHFVVDDPNEANAFIVEMYWSLSVEGAFPFPNCSQFIEHRLKPTIETIVDKHPYYNRSGGRDHFILSSIDNGVFGERAYLACASYTPYEPDVNRVRELMNRIANISLIQNSAHNFKSEGIHRHSFEGPPTFIVDQDIVISQPLAYNQFIENHRPDFMAWRPFDSSFEGSSWGDRGGLVAYHDHRSEEYLQKGLEDFTSKFNGAFAGGDRLRRAYFSYQPCGLGFCWSARIFESIAARSIPILAGSDLVMPFEKFLNWEAFSVKMTTKTWHNETGDADNFRKALRYESDLFRLRLFEFYESIGLNINFHGDRPVEHRITPDLIAKATNSKEGVEALKQLEDTMIWRKMTNMREVFPWFYFNGTEESYIVPWKHPFKLIQLEIWCRITTLAHRQKLHQHTEGEDLCVRPSNYIARSEYL